MERIERHMGLLKKIVSSYYQTNLGLEFEDLLAEMYLVVMRSFAANKYDASKGSESTFVWYIANNTLKTIITKQKKRREIQKEWDFAQTPDTAMNPEQAVLAKERWQQIRASLSPDAAQICDMVLKESMEENDVYITPDKPVKSRRAIIKKAEQQLSWETAKTLSVFKEIKSILKDYEKRSV